MHFNYEISVFGGQDKLGVLTEQFSGGDQFLMMLENPSVKDATIQVNNPGAEASLNPPVNEVQYGPERNGFVEVDLKLFLKPEDFTQVRGENLGEKYLPENVEDMSVEELLHHVNKRLE